VQVIFDCPYGEPSGPRKEREGIKGEGKERGEDILVVEPKFCPTYFIKSCAVAGK